jgi:hypothetical protein
MFIEYKAINYISLHCQHNHMVSIDQIMPQDCTLEVPCSIVGAFTLHRLSFCRTIVKTKVVRGRVELYLRHYGIRSLQAYQMKRNPLLNKLRLKPRSYVWKACVPPERQAPERWNTLLNSYLTDCFP